MIFKGPSEMRQSATYLKHIHIRDFAIFRGFRENENREKIQRLKIVRIKTPKFEPFFRNFGKPFCTLCFSQTKKGDK